MANEPTQLGAQWKLGFGGVEYTGYMPTDAEVSPTGESESVPDENGATCSVITTNKGQEQSYTFLIKSTGSLVPPEKDSLVSFKGPGDATAVKRRVLESAVKYSKGISQLTLKVIREASMAAAYDAVV